MLYNWYLINQRRKENVKHVNSLFSYIMKNWYINTCRTLEILTCLHFRNVMYFIFRTNHKIKLINIIDTSGKKIILKYVIDFNLTYKLNILLHECVYYHMSDNIIVLNTNWKIDNALSIYWVYRIYEMLYFYLYIIIYRSIKFYIKFLFVFDENFFARIDWECIFK